MFNFLPEYQGPVFLKLGNDIRIGFEYKSAAERVGFRGKTARIIHRGIRLQIIEKAHFIVFTPVAGSRMNTTGSGFQSYMGA